MFDWILVRGRPTPSDPPRRRGATFIDERPSGWSAFRAILTAVPWSQGVFGICILLLAGMVPWATGQFLDAMDRQIMAIDVKGNFVGERPVNVERSVGQWLGRSYFATDLSDIKAAVETRPWVESAAVKRVWPDRIVIDIREKKPLAYWNEGALVSRKGELFSPVNRDVAGNLPRLFGPDERVSDVIRMAQRLSEELMASGLTFAALRLEPRGAWTLTLDNGIEVVLGRDQVEDRFARFLSVYDGQLAARAMDVERVDARYSNGVAVTWKASSRPENEKT